MSGGGHSLGACRVHKVPLGTVKVLVIGPGGREHAIVRSLLADPNVSEVHAAPGNAGISKLVPTHAIDANDPDAVAALATKLTVDLVVVGPEAPLAAGVSDAVRAAGIPVFGPSKAAAQLEASKAFAKEVMAEAGVPTAMARVAGNAEEAADALDTFGAPYVVKDDGLAAGKGVVVTNNRDEALAHAQSCFDAGGTVVIEEFLDGPEVSVFVLCDGRNTVALSPAQDFKRIFDNDEGPNTGGMGAYTPLEWAPEGLVQEVLDRVAQPTVNQMAHRGTPFVGVLFVGLALTSRGTRVIEFNVRFGDPETQAVLARLKTPLGGLLMAAAKGELDKVQPLRWSKETAVAVVVAAENYPDTPRTGDRIRGLKKVESDRGCPRDPRRHQARRRRQGRVRRRTGPRRGGARHGPRRGPGTGVRRRRAGPPGRQPVPHRHRRQGGPRRDQSAHARRPRRHESEGLSMTTPESSTPEATDPAPSAPKGGLDTATLDLPGWRHIYSGKVRDLYVPADESITERIGQECVLVVASDRISAYDHVLASEIPDKGRILTQLSLWWFEQLGVEHHVLASTVEAGVPAAVEGRAMICKKLDMFPVECIARGYLTGSGLLEYRQSRTVCGIPLPDGLVDGSRLDEAIFTPSAKAEVGEHDENITYDAVVETVGEDIASRLRELTLEIYTKAEEIARGRGIILADTKVEFGFDAATGVITLGDEVLTPDSSRFWDAATYEPGKAQPSYDKQYVRDWLTSAESGWDKSSDVAPPALPADVVARTRSRYVEAYEKLTGRTFA